MLKRLVASFLPNHMRREIKELFASTLILNFGIMMIQLFEPIYLYEIGYSLLWIVGFFFIIYLTYFLTLPIGANFARVYGYEKSLVVSSVILVLYYIVFYFIRELPLLFFIAPVINALYRAFYWPAFHADFARYTQPDEEGREVGSVWVAIASVAVLAPLTAGVILEFWGFGALFAFASVLFVLSNIPLLTTKEVRKAEEFSYREAYRILFARGMRRRFFGYLGYGEEIIAVVVWPVFLAVVVVDFLNIGAIVSLGLFISVAVTLSIGRLADLKNRHSILHVGSIVYSVVWFCRLFARTVWGVFLVDASSRATKTVIEVPLYALLYDRAKHHKIMQSVAFFELTLVLAKLLTLSVLFVLLLFMPDGVVYQTAFVLGGLLALLYMLV